MGCNSWPKTLTKHSSKFFLLDMAQRTPTNTKTLKSQSSSRNLPISSRQQLQKLSTPMPLQVFAPCPSTNQPSLSWSITKSDVDEMPRGCPKTRFVVEEQFWRDLVPYVCKGGNNTKNNYQRFAWLSEDMIRDRPPGATLSTVCPKQGDFSHDRESNKFLNRDRIYSSYGNVGLDRLSLPFHGNDVEYCKSICPNILGGDHWVTSVLNLTVDTIINRSLNNPTNERKQLMDHISKWTNVLNILLEKAGHFKRTGRQPYNFELVYNDGLEFASPQQGNSSDCGVVTCWVIESLFMGRAPVLYNVDPNFFFSDFRVQMCLRLYNCRCEDTQECGYD
ncbi:phospholipase-like protein [Tanacetum coccineum]